MKKVILFLIIFLLVSCDAKDSRDILISNLYLKVSALQEDVKIEKEKLSILTCESGIRHAGVWGDQGRSYGIAQFQKRTFEYLKEKAGNSKLNWKVQKDQLWLLDWADRKSVV